MKTLLPYLAALGLAPLSLSNLSAEVKMSPLFGDHMVLQQNQALPVWGTASPGEKVTVTFAGQTANATAGPDGKWAVALKAVPPNSTPQALTIQGANTLTFQDVLVGDVWLASGQSNMEFGLQKEYHAADTIPKAADNELRFFFVPWVTALEPQTEMGSPGHSDLNGRWVVCSPEVLAKNWAWNGPTAVGYYFARDIREATHRPVGLIMSYKGGTPAEAWTSISGLQKNPLFTPFIAAHQKLVDEFAQKKAEYPAKMAAFNAALKDWNEKYGNAYNGEMAKWKTAADQAKAASQPIPPQPKLAVPKPATPPAPDGGFSSPGNLFNAMINPLIPYAIRGVIWYQGESNGDNLAEAVDYSKLFPLMITDWREKWHQGDFPFLFVQIANFKGAPKQPSEGVWPWVREAQFQTLSLPATGMASAVDIGDPTNIHPTDKYDVGHRLALEARKVAYGENIVSSGPLYDSMKLEGNTIRLHFKSVGKGLKIGVPPWTPDGKIPPPAAELNGFAIAGGDQKFHWAKARIEGDTVVVSSPDVPSPLVVRYDWADNPQGNLYNEEGLPASPFRTDTWSALPPTPAH